MENIFQAEEGQTPLDPDEIAGLVPQHIATRAQLNEWESQNIADGLTRARKRRPKPGKLLTDTYLRKLHQHMFGSTWRWAGTYRNSDKSLGIDWQQIPLQMRQVPENFLYRLKSGKEKPDKLAVDLHHQLVSIHPFPNGNGRWARAAADLLQETLGEPPFSWGRKNLVDISETRQRYIAALQAADQGELSNLLQFARS